LSGPPRLRPTTSARALRGGPGPGAGTDSRAPAREHVGAVLGGDASSPRSPIDYAAVRPHVAPRPTGSLGDRPRADGGTVLHLPRVRPAPGQLLGTLALRPTARPRGRLPRERVGRRLCRRPTAQDVHGGHRRGFHDGPSRAGSQLLSAGLRPTAVPLPG